MDKKNLSVEKSMQDEKNLTQEIFPQDEIVRLETNLDDCTGECLGYAMERLLEAGARDVFYTPVFTKKNRPAYLLTVLCKEEDRQKLEEIIFTETTSIGIRRETLKRSILPREAITVNTIFGEIPAKKCRIRDDVRIYPEYEGIRAICREKELPYQDVLQAAKAAIHELMLKEYE
ncbi:MAG: DUF111 family protein [Eubacterium sp.]|nr:DUF111 family protein [Eubacterium sp.]